MQAIIPAQPITPTSIDIIIGNHSVKVTLDGGRIVVRAESEAGKLLEGTLEESMLSHTHKMMFEDCSGVFSSMLQAQRSNQLLLSNANELSFSYEFTSLKGNKMGSTFVLKLNEVKENPQERLTQQLQLLEAQLSALKKDNEQLRHEIRLLQPQPVQHITPEFDLTTASVAKASVECHTVRTDRNIEEYLPFFTTHTINGRQAFEVEIVEVGSSNILFGVADEALRHSGRAYGVSNSLALYVFGSGIHLYLEKDKFSLPAFPLQSGFRVLTMVDRVAEEVEWAISYPVQHKLYKVSIPISMRDKKFVPVLHLKGSYNNLVRFV